MKELRVGNCCTVNGKQGMVVAIDAQHDGTMIVVHHDDGTAAWYNAKDVKYLRRNTAKHSDAKDDADKQKHTEVECRASMEVHTTQIAVCPICGQRYYRRRCYGHDAWAQENHGRRRWIYNIEANKA